ncbi:MAG: DeoR/GlpR family DNA-binding transcription regulator [Phycisphaerae bacterium]|nr:DeoR/GlpR family DNA-binding transcription regulator [Phycisphaerae bacterium]
MSQATRARQAQIMTYLLERKQVTVRDLVDEMGVSEATARRDLRAMAEEGQVRLLHGGAALPDRADSSFAARTLCQVEAKQQIGALAASLVTDGDQVFIDSGSTCFQMAGPLRRLREVTILLNSTRLAPEVAVGRHRLILLGGQYRPARMDTAGPITLRTLEEFRGYRAFIGADGLSMDFGPSAVDIESAHLYRQVVENARDAVLLVDHTKFQAPSGHRIAEWARFRYLVTDRDPNPEWVSFLQDCEIEILCPREAESLSA